MSTTRLGNKRIIKCYKYALKVNLKILTEFNRLKCNKCIVCNYAVLIIVKKIYIYGDRMCR